jgi:hypothetical protein
MPEGRRRWLLLGAVLLGAAVAVGVGVLVSTSDTPPGVAAPSTVLGPDATSGPSPTETPVLPPSSTDPPTDAPTVPAPETTLSPVPLDGTASFGTGVTARLTAVESVAGEASGPGEVAGPAVRVTVELHNGTNEALALNEMIVDVFAGTELAPGEPLSGPGVQWFDGTLEPGGDATGVYVFGVPADRRDQVRVRVSYDPLAPTVLFEGPGTPA